MTYHSDNMPCLALPYLVRVQYYQVLKIIYKKPTRIYFINKSTIHQENNRVVFFLSLLHALYFARDTANYPQHCLLTVKQCNKVGCF